MNDYSLKKVLEKQRIKVSANDPMDAVLAALIEWLDTKLKVKGALSNSGGKD